MHDNESERRARRDNRPVYRDPGPERLRRDEAELARFARGVARSEFGRFYWDDEKQAEVRAAAKPRRRK